ncbi:BTAD domain-containing putative transcriptional regulator [Nonomuraea basaltis]|uniref:BTAD domain-containing putative transcriptional regulator n=1 Tax=Nonomuraea basaltis TaxID=2495887 RepID=UPI00110C6A7D|nr:BTAD domain-containing putative transcriptional regulator [Nonomuraea basaltis]TMR91212.1 AfsR/SARP family transcriptional regulator [Nonomuraea basaltis]
MPVLDEPADPSREAAIRVRALGPLELVRPDRARDGALPFRSGNPRRAFAALLMRAGAVVSTDALAEVVWADDARPAHVEAALQTVMSRLRAQLRSAGLDDALLTSHPGYLLRIERDAFDVTRFQGLAERGRALLARDPMRAARLLDEGLGLWRGAAYAEFADEAFAMAEVARLNELLLAAREDRAEAALLLGRPAEAVAMLERVVAEEPLRERPQAQLMLALYRTGRQADALAVYRRYRELISDQLGLEPQAALRELETRILRHDPALSPPTAEAPVTAPRREARPPGNLPAVRTSLVGREQHLAQVAGRLATGRVLTLTGPGGVGKTRLALAVAHGTTGESLFPDGVWLVELAALPRSASVAGAVLTALAVQLVGAAPPQERLVDYLRSERLLLVFDNCEHVIEDAAALVQAVVDACPEVKVLATSRVPLGIESERIHPVPPLAVPPRHAIAPADGPSDAARLFIERAAALAPFFEPAGAALDAVEELCRCLDGIPLAIELAAGRLRFMTPAEIVAGLPGRSRFMRNPYRLAAERHQTLQSVVDWSYQLLDAGDRRLFEQLSVFAAGFTADDAGAVCDIPETVERLGGLVDKSMVVATADDTGQSTTYTLLETLRSFGRDRLAERADRHETYRAHARHLRDLLGQSSHIMHTPECGGWVAAVAQRVDELRAAHTWALDHDLTLDLQLMAALADWTEVQMHVELADWAEAAVARWYEAGDLQDQPLVALTLSVATRCAAFRTDYDSARALADHALSLLEADDPRRRYVLTVLAELALFTGDLDGADRLNRDARRWSLAAGDTLRAGYAHVMGILILAYGGDSALAAAQAEDFLPGVRSPMLLGWGTYALGESLLDKQPERAGALLEQAHAMASANHDRLLTGATLSSLASVYLRYGDPLRAVPLYRDVVEHWHRAGNWLQQWTSIRGVIFLLAQLGELRPAFLLLSAVRHQAGAGAVYGPDAHRVESLDAVFDQAVDPDDRRDLAARGAAMTDTDILQFALDSLHAAQSGPGGRAGR